MSPGVLIAASVLTIVGERILFKERRFQLQIASLLLSSTLSAPTKAQSNPLVIQPRDDLAAKLAQAVQDHSCALVVGPSGCGKMTLIRQVFLEKEGVLEVRLPVEAENYEDIVLEAIGILPGMPLVGALERIAKKNIEKPTIVLRLDKNPSIGQIERLLDWVQTLNGLAKVVVYMSASRAADLVDLNFKRFNTEIIDVDSELTQAQALAALRDVARSNDEAAAYVAKVGLRPYDLTELANGMTKAGPNSDSRAEKLANFVDEKRNRIRFIVREIARSTKFAKMPDEAKELFTQLSTGQHVTFEQIRTAMNIADSAEFFGIDRRPPYVFRVNAEDGRLCFTSALARVTFMELIQIAV